MGNGNTHNSRFFAMHHDNRNRPKSWLSLKHQSHIHHVIADKGGHKVAAKKVFKPDTAVARPVAQGGRE